MDNNQTKIEITIPTVLSRKKLIPSMYVIAFFCFFLSFVDLHCGERVESITGIELITKGKLSKPQSEIPYNYSYKIIITICFVACAFVLASSRSFNRYLISLIANGISITSMIFLKLQIDEDFTNSKISDYMFSVDLGIGYFLVLIWILCGSAFTIFELFRMRNSGSQTIQNAEDIKE